MVVITLTDCPPSLRGDLTLWLQEINTGVYVGHVSARVRDKLWERVTHNLKSGRATMVFHVRNEQRLDFRVHNSHWLPIDFDGFKLMMRPHPAQAKKRVEDHHLGFSKASKRQNSRKFSKPRFEPIAINAPYAVVDIETTGLSSERHDIIEIASIKIRNSEVSDSYHSLVKISKSLPKNIKILTGLNDKTIRENGKDLAVVIDEFLRFIGDLPLVIHNSTFDIDFLQIACNLCKKPAINNKIIDTLSLAKNKIKGLQSYSLESLVEHFAISDVDAKRLHRGMNDCIATNLVYGKLNEIRS